MSAAVQILEETGSALRVALASQNWEAIGELDQRCRQAVDEAMLDVQDEATLRARNRFAAMSISFDRALGIHQQALSFRAQRAEVLANNLANADTPNYKARDLDFAAVLAEQKDKAAKGTFATRTTNERHIAAEGFGMGEGSLQYRIPVQPSIDQNTVDAQIEQANYAENAMHFQASFTFLNSKFKGLVSALRGE